MIIAICDINFELTKQETWCLLNVINENYTQYTKWLTNLDRGSDDRVA